GTRRRGGFGGSAHQATFRTASRCGAGRGAAPRPAALLPADTPRLPEAKEPARVRVAARDVPRAVDRPRGAPGHLGCRLHVRAEGHGRPRHVCALRDQHQLGLSVPGRGTPATRRGNIAAFARPSVVAVSLPHRAGRGDLSQRRQKPPSAPPASSTQSGLSLVLSMKVATATVIAAAAGPVSAARAITIPLAITSPIVTGTRPLRTVGCHGAPRKRYQRR